MGITTILLIAVGLSMDSFAVSVVNGFNCAKVKTQNILYCSVILALTQSLFPLIGWAIGTSFIHYIEDYDHWIAFAILTIIGIKMLYEGIFNKEKIAKCHISLASMILLGVATSIDAFFVGISFAFLDTNILKLILIIGTVTLVFSISGHYIGKFFGNKHSKFGEIIGGVILIAIGIKILIEHLG